MTATNRHDAWQAGDLYEGYMGRWSRKVAPLFLDWLAAPKDADWLDIGCGTGALSAEILARCHPNTLISIDPSEGFTATAKAKLTDARVSIQVGDAQALDLNSASRDVVVSGLVLNFVPDRAQALAEMLRVVRTGGRIGFYVWDYPGGGLEFIRTFWQAAARIDPRAAQLDEAIRFPFCTRSALMELAEKAGLSNIESTAVDILTVFRDFDDYWRPFTLGTGPAPGYCASLAPGDRARLEAELRATLPSSSDGSIELKGRAWAIKAQSS